MNLPEDPGYQHINPWVSHRKEEGGVSEYLFLYVDNSRRTLPIVKYCWEASNRWVSVCTHIVLQDASWKLEPPSQQLGPWDGNITHKDK